MTLDSALLGLGLACSVVVGPLPLLRSSSLLMHQNHLQDLFKDVSCCSRASVAAGLACDRKFPGDEDVPSPRTSTLKTAHLSLSKPLLSCLYNGSCDVSPLHSCGQGT